MSIEQKLENISGKAQRASIKALGLADALGTEYSWTKGKYKATAKNITAEDTKLKFRLHVEYLGGVVFDDDVVVVNPPLKVNTGSQDAQVLTESPAGVIVNIIRDVVSSKGIQL